MARSLIREHETGDLEPVFSTPIDRVAGHYRLLYVDPHDFGDVRDVILLAFDEMPLWGTA